MDDDPNNLKPTPLQQPDPKKIPCKEELPLTGKTKIRLEEKRKECKHERAHMINKAVAVRSPPVLKLNHYSKNCPQTDSLEDNCEFVHKQWNYTSDMPSSASSMGSFACGAKESGPKLVVSSPVLKTQHQLNRHEPQQVRPKKEEEKSKDHKEKAIQVATTGKETKDKDHDGKLKKESEVKGKAEARGKPASAKTKDKDNNKNENHKPRSKDTGTQEAKNNKGNKEIDKQADDGLKPKKKKSEPNHDPNKCRSK